MKNKSKIFLVGFMGCGKSTLGKKISSKLGKQFIDLDDFIEDAEGMTIGEIFEKRGEDAFRVLEKEHLHTIINAYDDVVVSCGGGAPCYFDNMKTMLENGVVVYIKLPAEVLVSRLKGETNQRPLVANLGEEELLDFVKSKLLDRIPYYTMSDFIFDSLNEKEKDLLTKLI